MTMLIGSLLALALIGILCGIAFELGEIKLELRTLNEERRRRAG